MWRDVGDFLFDAAVVFVAAGLILWWAEADHIKRALLLLAAAVVLYHWFGMRVAARWSRILTRLFWRSGDCGGPQ